ncbi:Thylakoid lumenal protein [Acorus calamus]|uniref:Thylakoid lumenal protein n=1 Tax=Acorus calamus TaxID=4465 RepID=A0AAV9FFQ7_ACOCL|nr:Thylakoid lumenal protein [Acorus calamus]
MVSASLLTPTNKPTKTSLPQLQTRKNIVSNAFFTNATTASSTTPQTQTTSRRDKTLSLISTALLSPFMLIRASPALASMDDEYVKETTDIINKIRTTINKNKTDPDVATAVAELREASNYWVAKYRREKALLGRVSFRDMYSALNAVSGHYISFGPTAPIPAKRKARILEEMETVEKALLRGR